MSRLTAVRRFPLIALLTGALLACTAGAAQAVVATTPPAVDVTLYSPVVTGNIGAPASDVSVTVKLERAGETVDTAPVATTDAAGAWTATLPVHAVSNPADVLVVEYGGTGAPANARYSLLYTLDEEIFSGYPAAASVTADGSSITVYCATCAETTIPVHVAYADGSSGDVDATSSAINTSAAALTPAVGVSDAVTFTATFALNDSAGQPTSLALTMPARLPGQSGVTSCSANLSLSTASCSGLPGGAFDAVRVRSGSPDVVVALGPASGVRGPRGDLPEPPPR